MIGRRAIVGLSLLSALFFCALAAQGAAAAAHTSTNTTAFTCVKVTVAKTGEFADAHCDTTQKEGEYKHEPIAGPETAVETTNKETLNGTKEAEPAVLNGTILVNTKAKIECKTVSGTGTIENSGTGTEHKVSGTAETLFSNCTVLEPANCVVNEPIVSTAAFMGVDELGAGKNEMGLEFAETGGKPFAEITFPGEPRNSSKCVARNNTFKVTGSAIATGGNTTGGPLPTAKESGATLRFETANSMEEGLKFAGNAAGFTGIFTNRMKGGGNPIALTTPT